LRSDALRCVCSRLEGSFPNPRTQPEQSARNTSLKAELLRTQTARRYDTARLSRIATLKYPLEYDRCLGFALWLDRKNGVAWAQGTQEYRPMGAAVIAIKGQFRNRDFRQTQERPRDLEDSFAGFFGSLEEINVFLRSGASAKRRITPVLYRSGGTSIAAVLCNPAATSGKIPRR
jgi:hypothetical protein